LSKIRYDLKFKSSAEHLNKVDIKSQHAGDF
jgi:hypothetical protein